MGLLKDIGHATVGAAYTAGDKVAEAKNCIGEKVIDAKDSFGEVNLTSKVKAFTRKSVEMVAELDEELVAKQSPYEVGDFKVRASLSVVGGMDLDIHFVKTPTARAISDGRLKFLSVTNPNTGTKFKVPRITLAGHKNANVKDPENGDILCIDTMTGEVQYKVQD